MIYGYIRVSSKTQEDNNSRQAQLEQILARAKTIPDQQYIYNAKVIKKRIGMLSRKRSWSMMRIIQ